MDPLLNDRKDERIDVRVRRDAKELISRAAALMHQSVSDFVVSVVLERSRQVIEQSRSVQLTESEAERFLEALANPPEPNARLRQAAERYRKALAEGRLQSA
jgi:uncharacterized protein (DUF1778 family)